MLKTAIEYARRSWPVTSIPDKADCVEIVNASGLSETQKITISSIVDEKCDRVVNYHVPMPFTVTEEIPS